jgi:hypothetical protein
LATDAERDCCAWPKDKSIPIVAIESVIREGVEAGEERSEAIRTGRYLKTKGGAAGTLLHVQAACWKVDAAFDNVIPFVELKARIVVMQLQLDGHREVTNRLDDDNVRCDLDHSAHVIVRIVGGRAPIHSGIPEIELAIVNGDHDVVPNHAFIFRPPAAKPSYFVQQIKQGLARPTYPASAARGERASDGSWLRWTFPTEFLERETGLLVQLFMTLGGFGLVAQAFELLTKERGRVLRKGRNQQAYDPVLPNKVIAPQNVPDVWDKRGTDGL